MFILFTAVCGLGFVACLFAVVFLGWFDCFADFACLRLDCLLYLLMLLDFTVDWFCLFGDFTLFWLVYVMVLSGLCCAGLFGVLGIYALLFGLNL